MIEETTTLREAARRLARAKNPQAAGIQSSKLFSLLQAGKLRAGFYLGSAWVEIPIGYWQGLAFGKFRRIIRDSNDPKSGSYRLRGDQFPDQIAEILSKQIQGQVDGSQEKLKRISALINAAAKLTEVTIKNHELEEFIRTLGPPKPVSKSKAGRRPKEGWRDVCAYMAAYIVAHHRDLPGQELLISEAGPAIHDLATAAGVVEVPDGRTINEQVSLAMNLIKDPSFQLKKVKGN